jgi:IclR family acetate operon transcriptional repressor
MANSLISRQQRGERDPGEPLAAISVSGMTSRITDERLGALGEIVREVAAELTPAHGGVMPAAKAG